MAAANGKTTAVARAPGSALQITSVADLTALAEILYRGGLTPPGVDSPAKVAAVILAGQEVGLAPTQALGSIMLQGGRLSIYGDGALALVRASGLLESFEEWVDGEGDGRVGHCKAKRKGEPERHYTFSMREAIQAKLIERARGKEGKGWGPWLAYPDRMLRMRARGFLFRDHFPDVLRGLITYEEASDIVDTEVRVVGPATANPAPAAAAPAPTADPARMLEARAKGEALAAQPAPAQPAPAVAPQPDPVAPALVVPAGPVTDAQKERFLKVRLLVCASAAAHDAESQRAAWAAALAPFGVQSVGQLTADTAEPVLVSLERLHDPFGGAGTKPPAS